MGAIYEKYKKIIDKEISKVLFTPWQRFKIWLKRKSPSDFVKIMNTEIKIQEIMKRTARDAYEKAIQVTIPYLINVPVESITITWDDNIPDLKKMLEDYLKTMDIGDKMREIFG